MEKEKTESPEPLKDSSAGTFRDTKVVGFELLKSQDVLALKEFSLRSLFGRNEIAKDGKKNLSRAATVKLYIGEVCITVDHLGR